MLSDEQIEFGTLLRYSVNGTTKLGEQSKRICGGIKNAIPKVSERAAEIIQNDYREDFKDFFNEDTVLVPIPRHVPLLNNSPWPADVICQEFYKKSLCSGVEHLLVRNKKVDKSSFQRGAPNRPDIKTHYDSFLVRPILIPSTRIVIVDDVLTLGRTSTAAYFRLKEQYPDHQIRVFSIMRTRSRVNDNILREPEVDRMQYRVGSGKVQLPN